MAEMEKKSPKREKAKEQEKSSNGKENNNSSSIFPALTPSHQEPEYQTPPLPISSVGTNHTTATPTDLPYGSALLTDTLDGSGQGSSLLNSKGITHIIHAAPSPRRDFTNDHDFIQNIVNSVQNSILLADREDIYSQTKSDKLALPFVGGELFLGSCDPSKLAEAIIQGTINQLEQCKNLNKIILVDYDKNPTKWFTKTITEKFPEIKSQGIAVVVGDIRNKNLHGASVIVNAANTYVGFGGGISGAIKKQVGNSAKIDQKAKELIGKFYAYLKGENNLAPKVKILALLRE